MSVLSTVSTKQNKGELSINILRIENVSGGSSELSIQKDVVFTIKNFNPEEELSKKDPDLWKSTSTQMKEQLIGIYSLLSTEEKVTKTIGNAIQSFISSLPEEMKTNRKLLLSYCKLLGKTKSNLSRYVTGGIVNTIASKIYENFAFSLEQTK